MKTLTTMSMTKAAILCVLIALNQTKASAQSASGSNGLVFINPVLQTASNTDLKKGAVYLFSNVLTNVNATVRVDTLVGGAQLRKIDDNSSGLGYVNAFQPELRVPSGTGQAYVQFTFTFYNATTHAIQPIDSLKATAVDLDGNARLKEFTEVNMNGGSASYMSTSLDISVLQVLTNRFKGENILGIERTGIDTAAFGNMFTVKKSNISTFTVKYGAKISSALGTDDRQFSLYMKGFQYPNQQILLPVKLESFTALLNSSNNKVDLKWVTSSEKNTSHFVVEKSADGVNFNDAGTVFAYGNTSEKMNYSFTDNSVTGANVLYYRLRIVDADGRLDYSATRIIRTSKQNTNAVTILTYPNPVTSELRVTIPSSWQGKQVSYEIVNGTAQALKRINTGSSSQTETIDLSKLSPGFYVVTVSCGTEIAQQKIIKK
jgi:hypothetical protein